MTGLRLNFGLNFLIKKNEVCAHRARVFPVTFSPCTWLA